MLDMVLNEIKTFCGLSFVNVGLRAGVRIVSCPGDKAAHVTCKCAGMRTADSE